MRSNKQIDQEFSRALDVATALHDLHATYGTKANHAWFRRWAKDKSALEIYRAGYLCGAAVVLSNLEVFTLSSKKRGKRHSNGDTNGNSTTTD